MQSEICLKLGLKNTLPSEHLSTAIESEEDVFFYLILNRK